MNDKLLKFIDTNVLLYSISTDTKKKEAAIGLCDDSAVISMNVLNEFVNVSRKKLHRTIGMIKDDIKYYLSILTLVFPGYETFERALEIGDVTGYSHFDSLIIASAIESGCSILYTEDLQHGQTIDNSLKIINPFIG